MSIDLGETFSESVDRMLSVAGGVGIGLLFLYNLFSGVVWETFVAEGIRFALAEASYSFQRLREEVIERYGYAAVRELDQFADPPLDVGFPVAVALVLVLPLLIEFVYAVSIRAFAAANRGGDGFPTSAITDGLVTAYLRMLVADVIIFVLMLIGFVLLVVPGVVLAVLFTFVRQSIVVGGDGIFEGISNSVSLVRENVLEVVVLVIVSFVLTFGGAFVFGLIPVQVVSTFLNTLVTIYLIALVTVAYQQAAATTRV
jgi:hypothetical protein